MPISRKLSQIRVEPSELPSEVEIWRKYACVGKKIGDISGKSGLQDIKLIRFSLVRHHVGTAQPAASRLSHAPTANDFAYCDQGRREGQGVHAPSEIATLNFFYLWTVWNLWHSIKFSAYFSCSWRLCRRPHWGLCPCMDPAGDGTHSFTPPKQIPGYAPDCDQSDMLPFRGLSVCPSVTDVHALCSNGRRYRRDLFCTRQHHVSPRLIVWKFGFHGSTLFTPQILSRSGPLRVD